MRIESKGRLSTLTFFNVSEKDYGNYTCVATNKLGNTNASIILYGTCSCFLHLGTARKGDGHEQIATWSRAARSRAEWSWLLVYGAGLVMCRMEQAPRLPGTVGGSRCTG